MFGIKKEHLDTGKMLSINTADPIMDKLDSINANQTLIREDLMTIKHDLQQIKTSQRASQKRERKTLKETSK